MKETKKVCVYCGQNTKITDDHVPPKSFFPKPRPSNLITVPACLLCNKQAGKDEEFFLATFMFSKAGTSEAGKKLWAEKLHRMYKKNLGLRHKIVKNLKPINLFTPAGIYLGSQIGIKTDEKRFSLVVEKIVKGLYYFEYNEVLPKSTKIKSQFLQEQKHFEQAKRFMKELRPGTRKWDGVFQYTFNRITEYPTSSMWMLLFYNFATFIIITYDNKLQDNDSLQRTPMCY